VVGSTRKMFAIEEMTWKYALSPVVPGSYLGTKPGFCNSLMLPWRSSPGISRETIRCSDDGPFVEVVLSTDIGSLPHLSAW
jgi:hypothetical protein